MSARLWSSDMGMDEPSDRQHTHHGPRIVHRPDDKDGLFLVATAYAHQYGGSARRLGDRKMPFFLTSTLHREWVSVGAQKRDEKSFPRAIYLLRFLELLGVTMIAHRRNVHFQRPKQILG